MFKNLNASFLGVSGHESEIIELALTYGFKGIDLNFQDFHDRTQAKGIEYARRLIASALKTGRLRMGTFDLPIQWDVDDESFGKELSRLPDLAKMAADLGCKRCIATISPAGDMRPYHENFDFHKFRFGDICKALSPLGIQVGLAFRAAENLRKGHAFQFIHDMEGITALINMIGAPNIGLAFDSWNFKLSGASIEDLKKLSGQQIVSVRLADLPGDDVAPGSITEEHRFMPGTTGKVNFATIMATLREKGYAGPVAVAPHRRTLGRGRRDVIVERAGHVLDRLLNPAAVVEPVPEPVAAEAEAASPEE
ncbi:MAG: sugar phosphate isomerase/epimerase [Planctomycetaceae bacterium]|nr:sugar phosphate isomerase/epimerase [Planctomycetaceae bacterium]